MLLAGFDAGQTSTRCRVCRWQEDGWQIIGEGSGPGVSHLEASGGAERFRQAVLTSLTSAFEGEGERRLDAAVIGASGIEQGSALQPRATALLADALSLPEDRVLATGDERTALRGAFPDGDGIILISGTGMICLGRDHQGIDRLIPFGCAKLSSRTAKLTASPSKFSPSANTSPKSMPILNSSFCNFVFF